MNANVGQRFPQIAALLGQSWLKEGSIAGATDAEMFDRIVLGRICAERSREPQGHAQIAPPIPRAPSPA